MNIDFMYSFIPHFLQSLIFKVVAYVSETAGKTIEETAFVLTAVIHFLCVKLSFLCVAAAFSTLERC